MLVEINGARGHGDGVVRLHGHLELVNQPRGVGRECARERVIGTERQGFSIGLQHPVVALLIDVRGRGNQYAILRVHTHRLRWRSGSGGVCFGSRRGPTTAIAGNRRLGGASEYTSNHDLVRVGHAFQCHRTRRRRPRVRIAIEITGDHERRRPLASHLDVVNENVGVLRAGRYAFERDLGCERGRTVAESTAQCRAHLWRCTLCLHHPQVGVCGGNAQYDEQCKHVEECHCG